MHPFKTVLFIFSLLGILALACWLMPDGGITIGEMTVEMPSLTEALTLKKAHNPTNDQKEEAEVVPSVEDLLAMKKKMLLEERLQAFCQFADSSPMRLCLPEGAPTYLDPMFFALDSARFSHVRVLHYGDSQIEGDRISATLREYLQDKYGGGGIGMLPFFQPLGRMTSVQTTEPELTYYRGYGPSGWKGNHRRYGPMYQVSEVVDSATTVIQSIHKERYPHIGRIAHVTVLARVVETGEEPHAIYLKAGSSGPSIEVMPDSTGYMSVSLPRYTTKVELKATGNWEMYGLLLDDTVGVSLDNVPMRSNDGSTFSYVDASTITPYFSHEKVPLILLQFGTNAVPWLRDSEHISKWGQSLGMQIDWLKKQSHEARIILIGPPDMSTLEKGELQSYRLLPAVVEEMRKTAQEHRIAFWSMYDVMGGENSMSNWVNARPALACDDYVHFTEKGAERMANLLCQVLELYYKNYRIRNYPDEIYETETSDDSIVAGLDCVESASQGTGLDSH